METAIDLQVQGLGLSLLLGLAAGGVYDLLRILRRKWTGRAAGIALDLVFWLVLGAMLLGISLGSGTGDLRGWNALGLGLGCAGYLLLLSPVLLPFELKIAGIVDRIIFYITLPARKLAAEEKKICKFLKNLFHYWKKWVIVRVLFVEKQRELFPEKVKEVRRNEIQAKRIPFQDRGADPSGLYRHHPAQRAQQDPERTEPAEAVSGRRGRAAGNQRRSGGRHRKQQ